TGTGQALAVLEIGGVGSGTGNRVDVTGTSTYSASGGTSATARLKIGSGSGTAGRINGAVNVNGTFNYTANGGSAFADMRIKNTTGNITVNGTYTGTAVASTGSARVGLKVATNVDSPLVSIGGNWTGTASGGSVTRARIKVDMSGPTFGDVVVNADTNFTVSGSGGSGSNLRAGLRFLDGRNITVSGTHVSTVNAAGSPSFNFAGVQVGNGLGSNSATGSVSIGGIHTHTNNYSGSASATAGLKVYALGPVTLSGNQKYAIGTNGKAEVLVQTPTHITVSGTINADPVAAGGDNVAVINLAAGTSGTTGDLLITGAGALTASAEAAAGVFLGAGHDVTVNGPITVKTSGSGFTFTSFGSGLRRGDALLQFQPVGNNLQVNAPLTVRSTHQSSNRAQIQVFGVGGNANLIGGGQVTAINTASANQTAELSIGQFGASIGGDVTLGGNWTVQANGPSGSDGSAQILIDRVAGNVSVTGTGNLVATGTDGSAEASFTVRNVTGDVGINANYNYTATATPSDETAGARLNISNIGGNVSVAGSHLYTAVANGTDSAYVNAGLYITNVNTVAGSTVTVSGTQTVNATGNSSLGSLDNGVMINGAKDVTLSATVTVDVTASDNTFGENIGIFVNNARNVTVSGNNTITLTGVSGSNDVGVFLGSNSGNRNSGTVTVSGNNTVTLNSSFGSVAMKIWAAGPVMVGGTQRLTAGSYSGDALFQVDGQSSVQINPVQLTLIAGSMGGDASLTVNATGPVNSSGAPIAARLDAPSGSVNVTVNDPVSLVLDTMGPTINVNYPATPMMGNNLFIDNAGFSGAASFNIGAVSGGTFGAVRIVTGGHMNLNNNLNAAAITLGAGGDLNAAGRNLTAIPGLLNLAASRDIFINGAQLGGGNNLVMTAGRDVIGSAGAVLSGNGVFASANRFLDLSGATIAVGNGPSGAIGDPYVHEGVERVGIADLWSEDPNGAFIGGQMLSIGTLNLTFGVGQDASHVLFQADQIVLGTVANQMTPDFLAQFTTFDPGGSIGVEQGAPGVCDGSCTLNLSATGHFDKFTGTTIAIGDGLHYGPIYVGENGPVTFGSSGTQNVAFVTEGGTANVFAGGAPIPDPQDALAIEPLDLPEIVTTGIVAVIDPLFSFEEEASPGDILDTIKGEEGDGELLEALLEQEEEELIEEEEEEKEKKKKKSEGEEEGGSEEEGGESAGVGEGEMECS
ncbi:MAG: hypothetical protein D6786_02930, partial [Gammaproteobacteria bacterium]